ncbi:MAG: ATP-binding protein [Balneolaceae bacterium]|nr:ATP-binding protein [Balneolaceae bacterium]
MNKLIDLSNKKSAAVSLVFKRFLIDEIDWKERFILILGQRGAGKTTLLLQRMKQVKSGVYLSLDDIYFEANRLITEIEKLYDEGFRSFYLDEVHRYKSWARDLKNAYDNYPDIQLIVTGSSILELRKGREDLSRRAAVYTLPGLSFREFIHLQKGLEIQSLSLEDIIKEHQALANQISDRIDVLKAFQEYNRLGYYPFFKEGLRTYHQKLRESTNLVLDVDITLYEDLNASTVRNMKKLIYVLSQSVPFVPNISKLSKKLDIPRNTILRLLDLLERAGVLALLRSHAQGVSYLQKPEKIYLHNPNLLYLFSDEGPSTGNLRETFFYNQLQVKYSVTTSRFADFLVDKTWTFEVGGPSKTDEQIRGVPNAYIAADKIEEGRGRRIPLWLFGFLY